jgi:hypothetical protein
MAFVAGQILTTAELNALDINSLTVDTDTLVVDATNDRVGINKAAPAQALDVVGSAVVSSNLSVTGVVTPGQIDAFDNIDAPTSSNAKFLFGRSSSQAMAFHGSASGNQITSISQTSNPKNLRLKVSQDDGATGYFYTFSDVGLNIGSGSGGSYPLDVQGNARVSGEFYPNNGSQRIRNWGSGSDIDALLPGSTFGGVLDTNTSGHFVVGIRNNDTADSFSVVSGGTNSGGYTSNSTYDLLVANFRADGKVGIGTTSQSRTLEVNGTFHAPGNVVAMYEFHDNVANRSINGQTTIHQQTITTQGNTRLIMQLVTGQFVKSTSVTNLNIRWSIDNANPTLTAGSEYLETQHIGYGANNFREQLVTTANTGTLSAGSHTVRCFAESYGNHTVTLNFQSANRSSHLYIWEVCV